MVHISGFYGGAAAKKRRRVFIHRYGAYYIGGFIAGYPDYSDRGGSVQGSRRRGYRFV